MHHAYTASYRLHAQIHMVYPAKNQYEIKGTYNLDIMLSGDDKRFIVKSVENGYKVSDLAKMFNVTPRRVQQILKEDLNGGSDRKKFASLTAEEAREIEDLWVNYKIGSRTIYYLMKSKGKNVSYYQIYNFMRNKNMIKSKAMQSSGQKTNMKTGRSQPSTWITTSQTWNRPMPLSAWIWQPRRYFQWWNPER